MNKSSKHIKGKVQRLKHARRHARAKNAKMKKNLKSPP